MAVGIEGIAIRGKSLALIEKTRSRLAQIDDKKFPTAASSEAKQLVLSCLDRLASPDVLAVVSPEVLYAKLLMLQELVEQIEASVIDRISWPMVSYCDDIRNTLFAAGQASIFYSLTREHNYSLAPFAKILHSLLKDLLPAAAMSELFAGSNIFCLSLSSVEDDNLPLYANIGHEFGHALFSLYDKELAAMFALRFESVIQGARAEIVSDETFTDQDLPRTLFRGLGQELFCDLVGALIMGPAFLLSAYEMSWGVESGTWNCDSAEQSGYPSWDFRLYCIKNWVQVDRFVVDAAREFKELNSSRLKGLPKYLEAIPTDHSKDYLRLKFSGGKDSPREGFLNDHLTEIKQAYRLFLEDCLNWLRDQYGGKIRSINPRNIAELLRRLESDVLPNIIPDGSLLGRPAQFPDILNAAAMFRASLLTNPITPTADQIRGDLKKIERLTAKALEVSYIQATYRDWK